MTGFLSPLLRVLSIVTLSLVVVGCGSPNTGVDRFDLLGGLDSDGRAPSRAAAGGWGGLLPTSRSTITSEGSGRFVSDRAPVTVGPTPLGGQGYQLNLVDAPVPAAAKFVLGDTLGLNYSVDPNVAGTITLQTSDPVGRDALIDIFETTLAANGLAIVESAGVYRILLASDAITGTPPVSVPSVAPGGPGVKILVVQLRFISAEEMRNILSPISPPGAILRFDPERNYLMLAGTNAELAAMQDAISVFDADWMRGMSVALHPIETSRPTEIATELEAIFRTSEGGPGTDVIRFVPNEQLNSILVITSQPSYLARASEWIAKLDRVASSNEPQLFVYPVQNRPAEQLARVLQAVLAQEGGFDIDATLAPDLGEVDIASEDEVPAEFEGLSEPVELPGTGSMVVADTENNSLLIHATAREYREIETILRRLDGLPTQVLLEAIIVEVVLNDELQFGVKWFLENGSYNLRLGTLPTGFVGPAFPGLAWNFQSSDFEATLQALSSVTDVSVISSPTLMALNNQEAVLQIGDQVPIVTQTAESVTDPGAPIVNSVELRDTGIILNVIPRVNSSGGVLLDIEQEASRVVRTTSSGIDSPTIQQRRIRTRVILNDGEALVLGGLIQEGTTRTKNGVPILSDIPFVGNAFRSITDRNDRTELLIFVRPRVVRNYQEARSANEEFRRRLGLGQPETFQQRAMRDLQRLR
jgi:general secretion pathway protein D